MTTIAGNNHSYTTAEVAEATGGVIIRLPTATSNDVFAFAGEAFLLSQLGALDNSYNGFSVTVMIQNQGTGDLSIDATGDGLNMSPSASVTINVGGTTTLIFRQLNAVPVVHVLINITESDFPNRSVGQIGGIVPTYATFIGTSGDGANLQGLKSSSLGDLRTTNGSVAVTGGAVASEATLIAGSNGTQHIPLSVTASGALNVITSGGALQAVVKYEQASYDAFKRIRVSNPVTIFDAQAQYNDLTGYDFYHKATDGGSATHVAAQSSVRLQTTTAANSAMLRQSQRYMRYQPGKSQCIYLSFDFEAVDGGTKRVGYFDANNGVFFEMTASGAAQFVRRSSATGAPVDLTVSQSDWNIDQLNGTGPSGVTLQINKSQILIIDLQWLAVGRVRVGFQIDGEVVYAHQFTWANSNNGVYMTTANLPVRYELIGNGSAATFLAICVAVQSEGGVDDKRSALLSSPTGATLIACPINVLTHILSIRPKLLFNNLVNRGEYESAFSNILPLAGSGLLQIFYGATISGGSWVSAGGFTGIEYNNSATISGGTLIKSTLFSGKDVVQQTAVDLTRKLSLTLGIDGQHTPQSHLTVAIYAFTQSVEVYSILHWYESK